MILSVPDTFLTTWGPRYCYYVFLPEFDVGEEISLYLFLDLDLDLDLDCFDWIEQGVLLGDSEPVLAARYAYLLKVILRWAFSIRCTRRNWALEGIGA